MNMKTFVNATKTKSIEAFLRDGKYVLRINTKRVMVIHQRGKAHGEEYVDTIEKEFDTPEQANRYYLGIKKNNPTLRAI